ncbi:MAG: DNA translocase FtsK [Oscillospiraceae bacterium]|nr:DNA translocase FtsK [Oscillospiraceae bacterium]
MPARKTAKSKTASVPPPQKNRGLSVLLFAAAVLLLFLALVKGQNVWLALHGFWVGILGFSAYLLPFALGYIALLIEWDKPGKRPMFKAIQTGLLLFMIAAAISVFSGASLEGGFFKYISEAYEVGKEKGLGSGFFGALLAYPLRAAFGSAMAKVTVLVLLFLFFMLSTGTTLLTLFGIIGKPAKKLKNGEYHLRGLWRVDEEDDEDGVDEFGRPRFDVDVNIDGEKHAEVDGELTTEEKRRKLVNTYHGKDDGVAAPPMKIDDLVSRAADEAELEDETQKAPIQKTTRVRSPGRPQPPPREPDPPTDEEEAFCEEYQFPKADLLEQRAAENVTVQADELKTTAARLVDALRSFGVETRVTDISRGPTVTRYELQPAAGVKISKITNLADDIALNLATAGVRIEAPIPNKAAVGIEVPNKHISIVKIRDLLTGGQFESAKSPLTFAVGLDIAGSMVFGDIAKMPHMLIAGATGTGKSVCINTIIISILYKASPDEVKLVMIDPKVVELGVYNGIPHLHVPVVTEPRKAAGTLGWAVSEMEKRYRVFAEFGVRDLQSYNAYAEKSRDLQKMARIVIVIDELADLMMTAPNEVEESICRLAQKARAAGMHLVIATQRPSVDVITGVIKANIPSRIALAVANQIDSRVILDMGGAEKLLGRGDMLYNPIGMIKPVRVQGCFVSEMEVERVVSYIKSKTASDYDEGIIDEIERNASMVKGSKSSLPAMDSGGDADEMLPQAIECVIEAGLASTSLLQRRLKLGYARAARVVDQMAERGIVGPFEGSKPRKVLITMAQWLEMKNQE